MLPLFWLVSIRPILSCTFIDRPILSPPLAGRSAEPTQCENKPIRKRPRMVLPPVSPQLGLGSRVGDGDVRDSPLPSTLGR